MTIVAIILIACALITALLTLLYAARLRGQVLTMQQRSLPTVNHTLASQPEPVEFSLTDKLGQWQWCPVTDTISSPRRLLDLLACHSNPPENLYNFTQLIHPHDRLRFETELAAGVTRGTPFKTHFRMIGVNGAELFVELFTYPKRNDQCSSVSLAGVLIDVSARERLEQAKQGGLYLCPVTRQPNRASIEITIADFIAIGAGFSVILFDLLSVKRINESLGIAEGDQLIQLATQRLLQFAQQDLLVAHAGGGQFICVFSSSDYAVVSRQVERVLVSFKEPLLLDALPIKQVVHAGIALFDLDANTVHELLSCAQVALYDAKKGSNYSFEFYSKSSHALVTNRMRLESALEYACKNDELELMYQPKLDAVSRKIVGAEALLRWNSQEFGQISPEEFIEIAEYSEAIIPIGRWVVEQSCKQLADWRKQGLCQSIHLALNLSPKQFSDLSLVEHILGCIEEYQLTVDDIELEITETLLMDVFDDFKHQFDALKQAGIKLVVDDFGTGYASFSYLQRFAFDILKIDRSFVIDNESMRGGIAIAKALVAVAKALNMKVVAEGIESQSLADKMEALGCDELQGFYFGAALAADEFQARCEQ